MNGKKGESSSTGEYINDVQKLQKTVQALHKVATADQEVITTYTGTILKMTKEYIASCRKIWAAAVAWSASPHTEAVEYINAVADVAAEQFYTNMAMPG